MSALRVAFQGERGAYSEQALREHCGRAAEPLACPSFEAVFQAVEAGHAERGVVPIENSSAGSVLETIDLLSAHRLALVGEHYLKVRHCLLVLPAASRAGLRRVVSHPQALEQCREFLAQMGVTPEPFYDTAGAARWLAQENDPRVGALASALAAEHYGLKVLAEDVQSFQHNTTRFVVLARDPVATQGPCKTSLLFETRDVPAALYKALGGFATHGINLTKLESRPARTGIGRYRFYLECEGHAEEPRLDQALRELEFFSVSYRVLGSYPRGPIPA